MKAYNLAPDGMTPVLCPVDAINWDVDVRRLAWSEVGEVAVSTVFLALDHSLDPTRRPLLWETMVFDANGNDCGQWREPTWVRAAARHRMTMRRIARGEI